MKKRGRYRDPNSLVGGFLRGLREGLDSGKALEPERREPDDRFVMKEGEVTNVPTSEQA